jgi:glycosyltransferase involved in cell wall biosynthesis
LFENYFLNGPAMNVTLLSRSDINGGAAIASYRLLRGMRAIGHDARMIVREKLSSDPDVIPVSNETGAFRKLLNGLDEIERRMIRENRSDISNTLFSLPYPGYDVSATDPIRCADIINLHFVRGLQSIETIGTLTATGKPIVWTLHDQNPFTGGCHYSAGCEKYRDDCGNCPQLTDDNFNLPRHVMKNKLRNWHRGLTIVAPSEWMAGCARESAVFGNCEIITIPNGLETDVFKPIPKAEAKIESGIDPGSTTLLFGSMALNIKRKGFDHFISAIKLCMTDHIFYQKVLDGTIRLLTYGHFNKEMNQLDFPILSFGSIDNPHDLARLYSASDMFILPSLEDNLPNTMLESMACGTPVIGYDTGGIPDVIKHGETGYLVRAGDPEDLARWIMKSIADRDTLKSMGLKCSPYIRKYHTLAVQAENYSRLFDKLLSSNSADTGADPYKIIHDPILLTDDTLSIDGEFHSQLRTIFSEYNM